MVSSVIFDDGAFPGPPQRGAPLPPKGARGEFIVTHLLERGRVGLLPSPLWGRGWPASGVFISRCGPGEGVLASCHFIQRTPRQSASVPDDFCAGVVNSPHSEEVRKLNRTCKSILRFAALLEKKPPARA